MDSARAFFRHMVKCRQMEKTVLFSVSVHDGKTVGRIFERCEWPHHVNEVWLSPTGDIVRLNPSWRAQLRQS